MEERAAEDPIKKFERWRREAQEAEELQPDAMALATSGKDGHPSARFVMLRGLDQRGLVFYTNYTSRKAKELAEIPWCSLALYWPRCERQVRVEGPVEPIGVEESDAYFRSRPRDSQLETWASPQSKVMPSRTWLERRWQESEGKFPEQVPRPDWWGGYRVRPDVVEFWEQRPHRMHDRVRYRRQDDGTWSLERLAP